ncbi:hypothetical protein Tco_0680783 [Tanacetum coccineum]|uniref:Uncharacterized protein n=1 Tax=Tanacetum coccineum TaxID=301880 RepID=A0ABQ4XLH9_9ASTR
MICLEPSLDRSQSRNRKKARRKYKHSTGNSRIGFNHILDESANCKQKLRHCGYQSKNSKQSRTLEISRAHCFTTEGTGHYSAWGGTRKAEGLRDRGERVLGVGGGVGGMGRRVVAEVRGGGGEARQRICSLPPGFPYDNYHTESDYCESLSLCESIESDIGLIGTETDWRDMMASAMGRDKHSHHSGNMNVFHKANKLREGDF